jgi:hypothetical protein
VPPGRSGFVTGRQRIRGRINDPGDLGDLASAPDAEIIVVGGYDLTSAPSPTRRPGER